MRIIPREKVDSVFASDHLAWAAQALHCAQAQSVRIARWNIYATPPTKPRSTVDVHKNAKKA